MTQSNVSDLLLVLAACGYAAATALFAIHLLRRGGWPQGAWLARRSMAAGAVIHTVHMVHHAFTWQACPVKTIDTGVSLAALVAVYVYLALRKVWHIQGIGVFVAPLSLMLLMAGRLLALPPVPPALRTNLLPLHIASNVLGDAFFLLASGTAVMYLVQERQLKAKRGAAAFGRLPSLDALERAGHAFLRVGFSLMTIGVVTGTLWVGKLQFGSASEVLRLILGYVTWIVFSGVLLLRSALGWSGKRAAWGTLAGFTCALLVVLLYLRGAGMGAP